jgi:hypothetical protein
LRTLGWREIWTLSEDDLRQMFPHGALMSGGRWYPAEQGQEPTNTLDQLLSTRRERG